MPDMPETIFVFKGKAKELFPRLAQLLAKGDKLTLLQVKKLRK